MSVLAPAPLGDDRGAPLLRGQPGETLVFALLDTVGRALVDGVYEHKPFPTDYQLTQQYGVSRSVTRETVKMLTAKGLIASRPRLGNFVLPLESWNLFDPDVLRWLADSSQPGTLLRKLHELRTALEPEAAALAAQAARPGQIAEIQAALKPMLEHQRRGPDATEARIAFHLAVLRSANNPFYTRYSEVIAPALRIPVRRTGPSSQADMPDHIAVLVAIAARAPDDAHRAMRKLFDSESARLEPAAGSSKGAALPRH